MYKKIILIITILALTGCMPKQPTINTKQDIVTQIREQKSSNGAYINIDMPNSVALGKFLNIKAVPNKTGYLQIFVINPFGKVERLLPSQYDSGFVRANSRVETDHKEYGIKTFKPKGLHNIVVLFSEQKVPNSRDIIDIIHKLKSKQYGGYFIDILPIDVY